MGKSEPGWKSSWIFDAGRWARLPVVEVASYARTCSSVSSHIAGLRIVLKMPVQCVVKASNTCEAMEKTLRQNAVRPGVDPLLDACYKARDR